MIAKKLQYSVQLIFSFLFYVAVVVVIIYLAVCIFLFLKQTRFLFFPSGVIETTPEFYNLRSEEVWLPVSAKSGKVEQIHGWWIGADQPNAKVLLYLHGNSVNIGANVTRAHWFHQLGFSVLLIDYRGFGRSEGRFPNESRVYQDAATAWNYLVYQQKIPPSNILIYGHSLGGAIAIDLALKSPNAAGLVVESSFTSIRKVLAYRNNFWMFPVDLILRQHFDSITKVPNLKMPVLFIHGTDDVIVPAFMSQDLYAAAPEPKKLILVPGAAHNNVAQVAPSVYLEAIRSFVILVES
ncbi:alpha/beta hydrolase [Brasilonema octagenarum]|uniref:Phospholipase n=1 Tax=Brasilonema octagenarum UFV-OR1 TaxID=417115 RepID=A0ABX1MGJ1_9CYAN|nr:alpha/beta fold hydrolase [Brasilonema octagenarum]NMF66571.1 phospholipase [Brasilonema octagenarum UFV-OR1]